MQPGVLAQGPEGARIATVAGLLDLPTSVAVGGGHFERLQAEVRIDELPDGGTALARLRAGEVDFAVTTLMPVALDLLARPAAAPDDPVVLASLGSVPAPHLVTLDGDAGPGLSELAGRRVGVAPGPRAAFAASVLGAAVGGSGFEAVTVPQAEMTASLEAGEIVAAVLDEPAWRRLQRRFPGRARSLTAGVAPRGTLVLSTRRDEVGRRFGLCRALLRAYRDAVDVIALDPEAAAAHHARRMGVDAEGVRTARAGAIYDVSLGWSLATALAERLAWARAAGHPAAGDYPDVLTAIDTGPLRRTATGSVGLPRSVDGEGTPR